MFEVPSIRRSRGLAMLWKVEVNLDIQTYNQNHIDCRELWSLLRHLHFRLSFLWLCFSDFNEIIASEEKQSCIPKALGLIQDFRGALLHCGLINLRYHGNICTWNNDRERDAYVEANLEWREIFPHGKVTHVQASYSDHVPIMVTTHNPPQLNHRKRIPKHFEEKWASHLDCEKII